MIEVEFVQDKTTKNKVRFAEVLQNGEAERIGSLYISKWVLAQIGNPAKVTVMVEPAMQVNRQRRAR